MIPRNALEHGGRSDVLILGGGPAGSASALALAHRGFAVTVIERSQFEAVRLGETLSPDIQRPLARLGVWERFLAAGHLASPGIVSVWGDVEPYDNDFILNPYGDGWHIDRQRFDAMLALAAAEAGARIFRGAKLTSCQQEPAGDWRIEAVVNGQPLRLQAEFLVDATGRASWLAQRQGARKLIHDHMIGIVGFCGSPSATETCDQRTLVEAAETGWWYSALLPNQRSVAAFMTDADLVPKGRSDVRSFWRSSLKNCPYTSTVRFRF